MKKIEKEIANLDRWQKMAAIETPDGAQRIRGLAGSGKTVVLALKAAYLHAKHPDWIIALTFHSRSLYQQTMDLVRRFSFEHSNDEPNFENLRVMHSWGSGRKAGVYSEIAGYLGATPRDYFFAKTAFGPADAFSGVCRELLNIVHNRPPEPVYDAVLIDEAQDLPREFFELVFEFTKEPKRIVWAYDELQNLTNQKVPSVEDLFGQDAANARVDLVARPNEARRDIILPVCYRNTPWALTLAHALGLGIYRRNGLIQHFDFPAFWDEVGYQVENGELAAGQNVTLVRKTDSYPSYMTDLVNAADSVSSHCFANENEQAEYVASQITINLNDDELEFSDILLVLPDARRARTQSKVIMDALERRGISSHLVGVTTSQDEVFVQNSIAITSIFRAKGNEAPMVYLVNAHDCFEGYELIRLRNTLFTALTRSKAWVRICGYGENMRLLELEIRAVIAHEFRLQFRIPTDDQLNAMNRLHRDLTDAERVEIREAERGLRKYLDAVENGTISLDNLPINVRARLLQTLKTQETEVDDVE